MRVDRSFCNHLLPFIVIFLFGYWDIVSAADISRQLCEKASFNFSITEKECTMIGNYGSEVVSFAVRISDMQIIKEDRQQEDYMGVRIIPVDRSNPMEQAGVRWSEPVSVENGRKKYEVRGMTIYEFTAIDGGVVFVRQGLNTWQGDRIYNGDIEVNFQFLKSRNDFELLDGRLTELFQRMELQRKQMQP
jgi:hypothetical protein